MKILLGGIPLGRNNIGDEAIIAGVVKILRELFPSASLTVSTDDPATAERLGVDVCPLYGFDVVPYDPQAMRRTIEAHDATFWSGATGLSDYPEIPCSMLRIAQATGKKSVIWNVGMNSELNPAKYEIRGRKRSILDLARRLSCGIVNPLADAEQKLQAKARSAIREAAGACDVVITRDPQSREELIKCGVSREVIAGADSALVLEPCAMADIPVASGLLAALESGRKKVGICISAQREITNAAGLLGYLDGLVAVGFDIFFLPMNPLTDAELMRKLRMQMKDPSRTWLAEGRLDPEHILALAGRMDVIVASRLHLLILASILHVPILGISRGSKVDNFLAPYGVTAAGSVESCDFDRLRADTEFWSTNRDEFRSRSLKVRENLLARLEAAKRRLVEALA